MQRQGIGSAVMAEILRRLRVTDAVLLWPTLVIMRCRSMSGSGSKRSKAAATRGRRAAPTTSASSTAAPDPRFPDRHPTVPVIRTVVVNEMDATGGRDSEQVKLWSAAALTGAGVRQRPGGAGPARDNPSDGRCAIQPHPAPGLAHHLLAHLDD